MCLEGVLPHKTVTHSLHASEFLTAAGWKASISFQESYGGVKYLGQE